MHYICYICCISCQSGNLIYLDELSDGSHCKRQQEESMDPYLFLHNLDDTTSDSQIISSSNFKNTQRETNH